MDHNLIHMIIKETTDRIYNHCDQFPILFSKLPDEEIHHKTTPDKWSKLEILGHLLDSAVNNLQRFIRIPLEIMPMIGYQQNEWVKASSYQTYSRKDLIETWTALNKHICIVLSNIDREDLSRTGMNRDGKIFTLEFYIKDYADHMEHHLNQIVDVLPNKFSPAPN